MSPRAKLSIPFGGGLDRKTGATVVDPDAFADLRNVYLYRGRTMLRKGLARELDIGWGTDIVGIFSVRAQGLAAVIVFDDVSLVVRLYVVDGTLASATLIGTLWTLDADCESPPVVTGADLYDYLVLAHGEPTFALRGATRALNATTLALTDYRADLDRNGIAEVVRARVVAKHLNSLILGGYGTGADEDRPETLRFSKPGLPLALIPESYFFVGNKGDPILAFARSGQVLEVMKVAETHFFIGNGPKNFDIIPGDDTHGIAGMRMHANVGDVLYRWSLDGPRVSRGGSSDDLELPLNLGGVEPDESEDSSEGGFAYYDSVQGEVVFVFGAWGYALHLKDGTKRWSYRDYATFLQSAGRIYEGGGIGTAVAPYTWVELPDLAINEAVVAGAYGTLGLAFSPTLGTAGRYVLVGDGVAFYSDNAGATWTACTIDAKAWRAITWSPRLNLFVAVAGTQTVDSNAIATSPDGITFTARVDRGVGTGVGWSAVVDVAGAINLLVVVGWGGQSVTSPDGIVWAIHDGPLDSLVGLAVNDANSVIVAVGNGIGVGEAQRSTDGTSWTTVVIGGNYWNAVVWCPAPIGLFVAVGGSNDGKIATSPDGLAPWTNQPGFPPKDPATNQQYTAAVWASARQMVIVLGRGSALFDVDVLQSSDGVTYGALPVPADNQWSALAYDALADRLLAAGSLGAGAGRVMVAD